MTCGCIKDLNNRLKGRGAEVDATMDFADEPARALIRVTTSEPGVVGAKIEWPPLAAAYCPFCGMPYGAQEASHV